MQVRGIEKKTLPELSREFSDKARALRREALSGSHMMEGGKWLGRRRGFTRRLIYASGLLFAAPRRYMAFFSSHVGVTLLTQYTGARRLGFSGFAAFVPSHVGRPDHARPHRWQRNRRAPLFRHYGRNGSRHHRWRQRSGVYRYFCRRNRKWPVAPRIRDCADFAAEISIVLRRSITNSSITSTAPLPKLERIVVKCLAHPANTQQHEFHPQTQ